MTKLNMRKSADLKKWTSRGSLPKDPGAERLARQIEDATAKATAARDRKKRLTLKKEKHRTRALVRMGAGLDFHLIPWIAADAPRLAFALGHWARSQGMTPEKIAAYAKANAAAIDSAARREDIY